MSEQDPKQSVVELETQSLPLTTQATSLIIKDQISLDKANILLGTIKGLRSQISATFDPIIKKAHAAHKEAVAQKKNLDNPLVKAESVVKSAMATYIDAIEAERQAELARVETERKAELAVADAKNKEAEETATAMKDAGLGDLVAVQEPVVPEPVFQEHIPQPKLSSSSSQVRWHAEVTDIKALLKSIINGFTSTEAVLPNMAYLNGFARAAKREGEIFPGVKAVKETSISHKAYPYQEIH